MQFSINFLKNRAKSSRHVDIDTTAVIYALKTIKIDEDDLLGINKQALSLLNGINENENVLAREIEQIEDRGKKLYASIQIVSEAADVLIEYAKSSSEKINLGVNDINNVIDQLTLFTESTSNILTFVKPFNEYSQKIGYITDIIFKIAQMSESAARNAGIKAYHAGEYGRGFEVIADRMLLLANKTFKLTKKIPEGIEKIREYTGEIIESIDSTKNSADGMKNNIDLLNFKLKNISENLREIVTSSDKTKEFVRQQDQNKSKITDLNKGIQGIIENSLQSGEKLSAMVKAQIDIKNMILHHMQQVDRIMEILIKPNEQLPAISTEIKLFKKIENSLKSSKYISEQIISIIDEFIAFNSSQMDYIRSYRDTIDSIEDNEQVITRNIEDIQDSITMLNNSAADFNDNVTNVEKNINAMKNRIEMLKTIFAGVSENLAFILETSNELKELSESTRLLSLYASIEAARAGKFQQSLSVIVDQTKDLIVKASEASHEINKIVTNMQVVINNVVDIIDKEITSSEKINTSISSSKDIIFEINDSTVNFKTLIKEIFDSVGAQERTRLDILETYNRIISETNKINEKANELFGILKQDLIKNEENIEMTIGIEDNMSKRFSIIRDSAQNVFRFATKNPPVHWVPSLIGDASSNNVMRLIHMGLVKFGKDANVIPAIAKYWHINEDATEWTFFLRENIRFHDGSELLADDVKETFQSVLLTSNASFINMITGAKEYTRRRAKEVSGIRIIDEYTIKFSLDYPYIPFLSNLAVTPLSIVKKEMVKYTDLQMKNECIGCGPFMLEAAGDKKIVLSANRNYYEGEPYVDLVEIYIEEDLDTYTMLKNGVIDYSDVDGEQYEILRKDFKGSIKTFSVASLDIQYIGFNMAKKNEITANKLIRQAMNFAVDKTRYINETMSGVALAAKGVFPPGISSYNKYLPGYQYNLARAKELMNEAGYQDGIRQPFELLCSKSEKALMRAEMLKEMWEQIGIKIKIVSLAFGELLERLNHGKSEIFMMGWAGDTGEPDNFVYPLFHSDSFGTGGNNFFYMNKKVDSMIIEARKTANFEQRMKIYQEIEKIVVDEAPMIFMTHIFNQSAVKSNIHGYYPHVLNQTPTEYIWKEWSID